ncbi:DMT family transporter [[Clostridium] fimetarium]|uniref:Permease of the drug/metabolite transporter (DMT) superfamily n=1 Tax=[Clostridium] fimetarium TaxID=99656 RepID=A0A1I0MZC2_9FIRM|nr:DMT family transporter [[Clostridium] fimetarium]SEV93839.1 Permease of the drug/metabolite transporter (DMT) superfamily [[Clostridium] fimetarium]
MKQNKSTAGHLSALITILIWGTTFISTKILLKDFLPIEILFFRFILGLTLLIIVYPKRLKVTDKKQEITFACAGLTGVTLYYLLENIALTYSMASNVGVIISIAPFFTALLAHYLLDGEKLKANFFLGFGASMMGICLISFNGSTTFHLNPIGDLLAVLAAIVWACYSILTRKISAYGYNTIQTTRRVFTYGILFMIPTLFLFDFSIRLERFQNPVYLFNILFLGFGASALCFVTWNLAVRLLGAVRTSIYIYLVPVITVATSITILHEEITWIAILGAALALTGLFISEIKFSFKQKSNSISYAEFKR